MASEEQTRFDIRIPRDQKEYFEHAADLGGFRTMTEFVIDAMKAKAEVVIRNHEMILASDRDRKIFFDAMINPPNPGTRLKRAAKRHAALVDKK